MKKNYLLENYLSKEKFRNQFVKSLTIRERLDIFKEKGINMNISNEYIEKWRKRKSLVSEESFLIKLEEEGFTEKEFNYGIKELQENEYKILCEYLKNSKWFQCFDNIITFFKKVDSEYIKNIKEYNLIYALRPFIYWTRNTIANNIKNVKNVSISEEAIIDIINALCRQLIKIFEKTFITQLHIKKTNECLKGNSSEDRFVYFLKQNFTDIDDIINFYAQYAALTRILTVKTYYFIENIIEAFNRLDTNLNLIKNKLNIDMTTTKVKNILCSQGDSHQKSKSVAQFIFEDNNIIIYKPKNLKIEEKYYKFIKWFNSNSNLLDLPISAGFYEKDFTFETCIKYTTCINENQIQNFYERFGETLAIMYILCGNDFHYENIIASGEYPYIIDLETLFQNLPQINYKDKSSDADSIGRVKIYDSVLSTSLLPIMAMNNNIKNMGIDISGLNGDQSKYPVKVLVRVNNLTDDMKYDYEQMTIPGANNLPMLNGKKIRFKEYTDYIIKGFKSTIVYIMKNKEYLLSNKSILSEFKNIAIRCVLKSTQRYADLLNFSYHPSCSEDFINREKLFENMWAYPYKNKKVVKHEVHDMIFDDVPIFFSYCNSPNLISSNGEVIENYFEKSGFERVIDRIKRLNESELEKEISYIIVSFDEYDNIGNRILKENNEKFISNIKNICIDEPIDYLKESEIIGREILRDAIYSKNKDDITWIDVITNLSGKTEVSTLTKDFYNGLSGLALYYYYLYKLTSNEEYENAYKLIINSAVKKPIFVKNLTPFFGNCSMLYVLLLIYKNEHLFKEEIENIYKFIDENLKNEYDIDWLSGRAGLLQCVLNTYDVMGEEKYLRLAEQMGMDILKILLETKHKNLLGGMSHGVSGIGYSLFRLGSYINKNCFTEEAIELLKFDRSLFDKEKKAWIDIRKGVNRPTYNWCNGSIGVGMSRLMMQRYYEDEKMQNEVELSLKYSDNMIKDDDCLCHGNMGDIDFLLYCHKITKNPQIIKIINSKIKNIFLFKKYENSFRIKSLPHLTSVGMFTGKCGIGYELLRILEPNKVPSVLAMEVL